MGPCLSASNRDSSKNKVTPGGTDNGSSGIQKLGTKDIMVNKKLFMFDHASANIRDDYLIGKVLGTGAFGEVRLCTHRKTGIKRAVKIIKKSFL